MNATFSKKYLLMAIIGAFVVAIPAIGLAKERGLPFALSKTVTNIAGDDIEAPVITSRMSVVGTSTVKIRWDTNEEATSKVYFSEITPLDPNATSTSFITGEDFTEKHSLKITGLESSTTYYLIIESTDASGNIKLTDESNIMTGEW